MIDYRFLIVVMATLNLGAAGVASAAVNIDVGRQLFVDDWLVDGTQGVVRVYNHPTKAFDAPVMWPETDLEREVDTSKAEIVWKGGNLASLAGRPVRFRFKLHCGTFYSFWVSKDANGKSGGYLAAGGPAYKGLRDL